MDVLMIVMVAILVDMAIAMTTQMLELCFRSLSNYLIIPIR